VDNDAHSSAIHLLRWWDFVSQGPNKHAGQESDPGTNETCLSKQRAQAKTTLSVVIPAYNEEARIETAVSSTVESLTDYFNATEVIVVDDGSEDATAVKARQLATEFEQVRALSYDTNQGKGYAVRQGISTATGEFVAFIDADTELNVTALTEYVERLIDTDADVVVGSKRHPDSDIEYTAIRTFLSKSYSTLIDLMFDLHVDDTQVGLKVFRQEVVEQVVPEMVVDEYAFDIELLALASCAGFDIREAPVDLDFNGNSGIDWKSILRIGYDTARVFYRHRVTKEYDIGRPGER